MGNWNSSSSVETDTEMESEWTNQTNDTQAELRESHLPNMKLFMVSVYSIMSFAIFFNVRVIYIVLRALCTRQSAAQAARQGPSSNQHAFVYVLSLSIVDSFVLAHLPLVVTDIAIGRWIFGTVVCKLYWIIEQVNRILSTYILTALSGDRYLAVCHPFNQKLRRFRTTNGAVCVIGISVFVAGTLLMPTYIYSDVVIFPDPENRTITKCAFDMNAMASFEQNVTWENVTVRMEISRNSMFLTYIFFCGYFVPLASMVYFYTCILLTLWKKNAANTAPNATAPTAASAGDVGSNRIQRGQKRAQHVTQRVLVLVLFYFGCWTPYWAVQFYIEFIFDQSKPRTEQDAPVFVAILVAHLLTYLNSAVNPFLYALLNKELQPQSTSAGSSIRAKQRNRQKQMTNAKDTKSSRSEKTAVPFSRWLANRQHSEGQDPNEIPLLTQNSAVDTHASKYSTVMTGKIEE